LAKDKSNHKTFVRALVACMCLGRFLVCLAYYCHVVVFNFPKFEQVAAYLLCVEIACPHCHIQDMHQVACKAQPISSEINFVSSHKKELDYMRLW
jgi:hypothetical protein